MDSGATHHIAVNETVLSSNKVVRPKMDKMNLPNCVEVYISHTGEAIIF